MKKAVIAAALSLSMILAGCASAESSDGVRERFENTGSNVDSIRIITDAETGVQYLYVCDRRWGYGGMGGLTVLVDADGKPLIAEGARND